MIENIGGPEMAGSEHTPIQTHPPILTPDPIIQIASGFLAAKHLFVANELGLFEALSDQPKTLDALCQQLSVPARTLRIIADALVALEILQKEEGGYSHSAVSHAFLSGAGTGDLRPFLRFWNRLSYPNWMKLEQAIRGETYRPKQKEWTAEEGQLFSEGVEAITAGTAEALAHTYDFSTARRVLDLGGGTGSFLLAILRSHGHIQPTLFEQKAVIDVAQKRFKAHPPPHSISLVAGDFLTDALPEGHDHVIVANVLHLLSPDNSRKLLTRIRESVSQGGRILLIDFWTDATHTQPPFAALMAGEFLLVSPEGDVYSVEEIREWLTGTGWRFVGHRSLAGPASLIIAETV
jgi:SAM-dependent methyltransferase